MVDDATDHQWLTAARALAVVLPAYGQSNPAKTEIIRRAKAGLIETRCTLLDRTSRDKLVDPSPSQNVTLDRIFWADVNSVRGGTADWVAGTFRAFGKAGSHVPMERLAFSVMFREDQVLAIIPPRPKPPPRTPETPEPEAPERAASPKTVNFPNKVPRPELREWLREYSAVNHGLSEAQIAAAASIQFAGRRVTRQPLRDVIGELNLALKPGNPAIRRK